MSVVLNCVVDEDKEVGEAAALKAGVIVFQASKEGGAVPSTSFLILNAARAFLPHRTNRFATGVCVHKHHRRFLPLCLTHKPSLPSHHLINSAEFLAI